MHYEYLYKEQYSAVDELKANSEWDLFISAYNKSDRVHEVYNNTPAKRKVWLVHEEYEFSDADMPKEEHFFLSSSESESEATKNFFRALGIEHNAYKALRICIDSTGFMRPTLLFMILYLAKTLNVEKFDILYSEPVRYEKNENTTFSKKTTGRVKAVEGYDIASERDNSRDALIIGSGFDNDLIAETVESKKHAQKIQVIGFPSLQADMYQQNIYRASKVDELDTNDNEQVWFAPAYDPFQTANTIRKIVERKETKDNHPITNLYLAPLSTKAQTIGFALYYINECYGGRRDANIIIPESKGYSEKTSIGLSSIWKYGIEFDKA